MKPDSNVPGVPYNFDAIPVLLKPDLWDETKNIRFRGLLFVLLYTLLAAAFVAILAVPVGFYKGRDAAGVTALIWLVLSLCLGIPYALAVWWDFIRASCRLAAAAADSSQEESLLDRPEEHK
jgi:lysylphosphatidylglycerol synthetase-like protein (DUF2156 family)